MHQFSLKCRFTCCLCLSLWCSSAAGIALDLRSVGRGFKSYSRQCCITTLGSCLHLCASVTKQYNLVPAKGWWCSAAAEVTAGLAESSGSLQPAGWLTVTCGLTACTLGSAPGPTLGIEYGKAFTFASLVLKSGNNLSIIGAVSLFKHDWCSHIMVCVLCTGWRQEAEEKEAEAWYAWAAAVYWRARRESSFLTDFGFLSIVDDDCYQ